MCVKDHRDPWPTKQMYVSTFKDGLLTHDFLLRSEHLFQYNLILRAFGKMEHFTNRTAGVY